MKNKISSLLLSGVFTIISVSAFAQQSTKPAQARKDLKVAQKNLREAKKDSIADFQKFRTDTELKINANQKKLAELKSKNTSEKMEIKEAYDKKVLALEQKNNALRNKINGSDNAKITGWEKFKSEVNIEMEQFNRDMENFGKAITDN